MSDRCSYVIAANALATALNPDCVPGVPQTRLLFLNADAKREIYINYDEIVALAVASLRMRNADNLDDPRLQALVAELTAKSPHFKQLWSSHDVSYHAVGIKSLRHPVAGQIDFRSEAMWITDTDHYILTLYYVDPGTPSAAKPRQALRLHHPATSIPQRQPPPRLAQAAEQRPSARAKLPPPCLPCSARGVSLRR